ncbi:MAG: phosphotransferase [Alphaproteobacteria bacterium]|nr:phosphotransferase [Alphaproteobacteria bacterium]MDP6517188.1 phosphotransferase [Alphaproteobacteria bacterium]
MTERDRRIVEFLAEHGWGDDVRRPLAGDASFRRYERLEAGSRRAVLMDAPPPEDVRPFVAIARHLIGIGMSAPRIIAEDPPAGLLLLEDFGDDIYTRVLAGGGDAHRLYGAAVDLLCALQRHPPPRGVAPYDMAALMAEAELMTDWYLPAIEAAAPSSGDRAGYRAAWSAVLPAVAEDFSVLVLRDYHADNLIWLADRPGLARVGLLDFQDALVGAPAYDLVSLLEDARRDVAPDLAEAMIERYLDRSGTADRGAFRTAYAILGAQRNAKIIGIFTRLWKRDGKPDYLALIPRVWRLLTGDLEHPALAPVRAWFDRVIPPSLRRPPEPS